jgi:hypothetical protein
MAAESVYRDFASVLDELLVDEAARRGWSGVNGASLDYLSVTEALHSGRIVISDDTAAATYREAMETHRAEGPPHAAKAAPPRPLPSTDPAVIARELGLDAAGARADLDLLRRRFAFSNHPDRVEPGLRVVAMARMQIANMLIDDAKKRRTASR